MTNIPSNLARVPNSLAASIMLESLARTQKNMLDTQVQLATGQRINRTSDDPLGTSLVSVLDDIVERRDQRLRNLSHADAVLNNVEAALSDASDLVIEAKGIASSQVGVGSDVETRRNQAAVVDSLLLEAFSIANRRFQDIQLFGGGATAGAPMTELLGGFRYTGQGRGMSTDVGLSNPLRITMAGEEAFGALSARVEGNFDLDPAMETDTRLVDLNGARGLGVSLGEINVDVGGTPITVDLSTAHTVGDVVSALQTEISAIDAGVVVAINPAGNAIEITPSPLMDVTMTDLTGSTTAADLGLDPPGGFLGGLTTSGNDVDPHLTEQTSISSLTGVTVPMGTIRIGNAGLTRDLDLSGVSNVQELMNAVESLHMGVRVEIADGGDRLNFINELSGGRMSIAEVGGGLTATELGVRTLADWTLLDDFNDGRGIQIRTGSVDAQTGMPDPAADVDFRISLKDGTTLDIDLAGAQTVGDVLAIINGAATVAGAPATAGLAADGNGITITDGTIGVGATAITARNGSYAGEDLGIIGTTAGATLTSEDRATVAVDSVFSHLISLRDALLASDERGITFAAERFDADISRLSESRADIGVRSRRVANASDREDSLRIQDLALRSQVRDLDYTEASIRFSTLQQQLQAGLITASRAMSLSLLDFLTP